MDISDWLTLIIAVYGAVISSILGFRELNNEKRRLKIFIEYAAFYETPQMTIVNVGHRCKNRSKAHSKTGVSRTP